ncbi:MAG: phosphotransferase family protein [Acidimicrobiales bacterium]
MEAALRRWVEETTGATVTSAERGFGGGSRELWFVETGSRSLVLRAETGAGAFHGTPLTLEREVTVCRALWPTNVPVAEVLGITDDSTAVLMARLPGTSDLRRLDPVDHPALVQSFMGALGALHRLDVERLDLPGFARPERPADHALKDLALWDGLVRDHLIEPDPQLGFASAWLRAHAPSSVARTVLVHGDAGPGNFLYDGAEVTGLVDWEMSHLGDPMDDIAWLDVRSAASGASGAWGDVAERDRLYERASGIHIDAASVAYYRVLVHLRCAITTALAIERGGSLGVAAYEAPHHRFLVQLASALGDATGTALEVIERPIAVARAPHYDRAIEGLRSEVLPALRDRPAKLAARAALLALEHAREVARVGSQLAELERQDARETFGSDASSADAIAAVCAEAGEVAAPEVLAYLLRRAQRRLMPWATPAAGEDVVPVPSPRSGV